MSLQSQLNLQVPESEDSQLDLFPQRVEPDYKVSFSFELDPELARWRRRALFLTSVFLHLLLALFLAFAPDLLRRGRIMMGIPVTPQQKQITTLFLPPDLLKSLREPPPQARPSDKNRHAQGRSPIIDPNGIHMPYSRGNTREPEASRGKPPMPPPAPAPTPTPAAPAAPPAGQEQAKQAPPPPPQKPDTQTEAQLHMDDVPAPGSAGANRFKVPALTPGQVIQQSLQEAARGGYHPESGMGGGGDSAGEFNNLHPNFSTEAPTILSDTRGVDFGPYLARIVMLVRRNWISIIPESARLGQKGRVGVVFEILKDGSMPQERMVASSGADPLDRAAFNAIHASAPFPPLPQEFTGQHLVLQFVFLYNETPN